MASSWRRQTPLTAAFICFALLWLTFFHPAGGQRSKVTDLLLRCHMRFCWLQRAKLCAGAADVSRLLAVTRSTFYPTDEASHCRCDCFEQISSAKLS